VFVVVMFIVYFLLIFRAVNEVKFSYLLKTDDDCFVDVIRVLERLAKIPCITRRVWLGRWSSACDVY